MPVRDTKRMHLSSPITRCLSQQIAQGAYEAEMERIDGQQ